jgi:hypothetical protein
MNSRIKMKARNLLLSGAVICAFAYSAAVLLAPPAYAAGCTAADCSALDEPGVGQAICNGQGLGTWLYTQCTVGGGWYVYCQDGEFGGACTN